MSCNAIIEQGANKGNKCSRPILNDGYCGKHIKQAHLKKELVDGKHKCSTHRCTNILNTDEKWCVECINKRNSNVHPRCVALLEQSRLGNTQCTNSASIGKYCKLHSSRNTLLEDAKLRGVRICDDGKRACKNETQDMKLKCEECLAKNRMSDTLSYKAKKDAGLCLNCGIELDETVGFRKEVQRCETCYNKLRDTESKRQRAPRNYKQEYMKNINPYYGMYHTSAKKRNLEFALDVDEFKEIVYKPCYYCKHQKHDEVNGIDRINSNIGYVMNNIVPCCNVCNYAKGSQTIKEFIQHCKKVASNFEDEPDDISEPDTDAQMNSYIRPSKILHLYNTKQLNSYIDLCKKDGRSPTFIEKIEQLEKNASMTENEARVFIKNALQCETHMKSKNRVRISKSEMIGYLDIGNVNKSIEHYELAYGNVNGFAKDMHDLAGVWKEYSEEDREKKFNQLLIKYQNLRNRK